MMTTPADEAATKAEAALAYRARQATTDKKSQDWRIRARKGAATDEQSAKACGQCVGAWK